MYLPEYTFIDRIIVDDSWAFVAFLYFSAIPLSLIGRLLEFQIFHVDSSSATMDYDVVTISRTCELNSSSSKVVLPSYGRGMCI